MNPWLITFLITLALVIILDTHGSIKNLLKCIEDAGCQGLPTLKYVVYDNLKFFLIDETILRLVPLLVVYTVFGPSNQVIAITVLVVFDAGYILGSEHGISIVKRLIGAALMISLWVLLMPIIGLWLTYASVIAFRLLLAVVVYYLAMASIRHVCAGKCTEPLQRKRY